MTTTEHADQPPEASAETSKPSLVFPKMWVLFGVLICCFTAWGVAADLTTPMVAGFKRIFDMSTFQASLVQLAYFGAYFLLAIRGVDRRALWSSYVAPPVVIQNRSPPDV